MDLYLYSKRLDLAATSLSDLQALIAALADELDPTNAAIIANVTGKVAQLVQGDTGEPLVISSYDDASTVSSWVTDASVTLACGLGTPDPLGAFDYASTTSFSISGSTRLGTLALNTVQLRGAVGNWSLGSGRVTRTGPAFYIHLRKNSAGNTETVARIPVTVVPGILESDPVDSSAVSYLSTVAAAAAYLQNRSGILSLTGGGATALDGLVTAGSTAVPVGCIVILSYGLVTQFWKLVAGTDAENVSATPAVVRPDDYNASTNAVVWKQIG